MKTGQSELMKSGQPLLALTQVRETLFVMVERRLNRPGPPPTKEELEGLVMLGDHLWHPALGAYSPKG
ncbi:hypothetical protein DFP85_11984 [Halomonas ventosae]|uniref:Uncharacterized protein n=1 Tax=Halomonas ventosae TaxID=229007 RepID=A0A4R6ZG76_9GAMM|nr:hypothetical protein [Halomonas ventosae]TDR51168.1 hypothetical protein DFP85_11984 [Halomonas ventosae]